MPVRRLIAAVLAVAVLGLVPGAALAQSGGAGDDQYVDPFGSSTTQQQHSGSSGGSKGSSTTSTGPALSSTPALSASSSGTATTTAPGTTTTQMLPRTGTDAALVAAIGLALLVAGAALRVRLRDERL